MATTPSLISGTVPTRMTWDDPTNTLTLFFQGCCDAQEQSISVVISGAALTMPPEALTAPTEGQSKAS